MVEVVFREAEIGDLDRLIEIENSGFTPEEAATPEALELRIKMIPDSFIVALIDNKIVGFIDGPVVNVRYISDDLFDTVIKNPSSGGHQTVLGLVVCPELRNQGVASKLLQEYIRISTNNNRETITLTCREELIKFYEKNGFKNEGKSNSTHGGYIWYNMIYEIK